MTFFVHHSCCITSCNDKSKLISQSETDVEKWNWNYWSMDYLMGNQNEMLWEILNGNCWKQDYREYRERGKIQKSKSIGTILCTERQCCQSSLLGYRAQSWMGHQSDAGYSNGSIIPAKWYSFCRPRKDDRLRQPHLVLIQRSTGASTQDPKILSQPP